MLATLAQFTNRLHVVETQQQPRLAPHQQVIQPPPHLQIGNGWLQPPQPQGPVVGEREAAQRNAAEQAGIKANAKRAVLMAFAYRADVFLSEGRFRRQRGSHATPSKAHAQEGRPRYTDICPPATNVVRYQD